MGVDAATGGVYEWDDQEDERPDVFILNNAAAYSTWYQVRMRPHTHALSRNVCFRDAISCVFHYRSTDLCCLRCPPQTLNTHANWMTDLVGYLDGGKMLTDPPVFPGRPGVSKPMRLIWFTPPFIFSQAHAGTEHVTTHRQQVFDAASRDMLKGTGVIVFDGATITKAMWESAFDGLHYLRGLDDNWFGTTANMVTQALLNVIFPTCAG